MTTPRIDAHGVAIHPRAGAHRTTDSRASLVVHSAGFGAPLILLHGLTSSHHEWMGLKTALMRSFTCVAWDARGHGERDAGSGNLAIGDLADDLAAVVGSLGPRKPVLVGHSLGAVTILEFVRRYGCEALAGIVLVDHPPRMLTGPGWELGVHSGFTPADNLAFEWQVRRDPAEAYLRLLAFGFNAASRVDYEASTDVVQRIRERLRGMPMAPWLSLWKSFAQKDYRQDIGMLRVPLLTVLGGASNFYDAVRLGRWFVDALPHTEVIRYDGVAHAPHLAAPARFARDVARFAARCTAVESVEAATLDDDRPCATRAVARGTRGSRLAGGPCAEVRT